MLLFAAVAIASLPGAPPVPAARARPTRPASVAARRAAPVRAVRIALDAEILRAMKSAPKASDYPNRDCARLLDLDTTRVEADGSAVTISRTAYKLFNERARPKADVSLPFSASYQKLELIQARTIKRDGTVMVIRPADVVITSRFSDFSLYDDAKLMRFSLPGIEDNCFIDYTYRIASRPILPGHYGAGFGFSAFEPVGLSRVSMTLPAAVNLRHRVHNNEALKPAITTSADGLRRTYVWQMERIAPIEPEPCMPGHREVAVWLEVSTMGGWDQVAQWYWGLAGSRAAITPAVRQAAVRITAGRTTDDEKARAIYEWVADRVRYVAVELGMSAWRPHAAGEVHAKLYGDCKDKATLLIAMLGAVGIRAHPVLLSAGDATAVHDDLPHVGAFDHCIALADVAGRGVWLDATSDVCAYGAIPSADRGAEALVIRDGAGRFETIPALTVAENSRVVGVRAVLRPDGGAAMTMDVSVRGETAEEYRAAIRQITHDKRKEMMEAIARGIAAAARLKDFTVGDPTVKADPYLLRLVLEAPALAKKAGNLLIVPTDIGSGRSASEFTRETRTYPIVNGEVMSSTLEMVYILPDGFAVDSLPPDVEHATAIGEYRRTIRKSADGREIRIVSSSLGKRGRAPASDYAAIRAFDDAVNRDGEEQIVLRRTP